MTDSGFILQASYRVDRGGRPVVHLWGRTIDGHSFLVRDDSETPHFYVPANRLDESARLGAECIAAVERTSMDGMAVARIDVEKPSDVPPLRDRLARYGIPCFEADLRFAMSFLIDRQIRGAIRIDGEWTKDSGVDRLYVNPQVGPGEQTARLSVVSIDIETDPRADKILSIAISGGNCEQAGDRVEKVLLLVEDEQEIPSGALAFGSERDLLRAFVTAIHELDPDVITGWNVIDFDFRMLAQRATRLRVPLHLGRGSGILRLRPLRSAWGRNEATIPGRVVLDGVRLLRSSFVKMESYSLQNVAIRVLGKGKLLSSSNRLQEILDTYAHDRQLFVDYNLNDARLVIEILDRLKLVDLAVERSLLTGLPIDRVAGSIAAFDSLYLAELHRQRLVAPTVGAVGDVNDESFGGHVLEPRPGWFDNVLVFDFKSLYPSIIRTFNIDPVRFVLGSGVLPSVSESVSGNPRSAESDFARELLVAPNGAKFDRRNGILPGILDRLFPERQAAVDRGDQVASQAIKILMNSFYGVLGTPASRFYRPEIAGAITAFGREILLHTKTIFEARGLEVLYGDTDSLFVLSGLDSGARAGRLGEGLVAEVNAELETWIMDRWRVDSLLELQLEKLFVQLVLPEMRRGGGGARKRYVGLLADGEVMFVGMEVVRRDWTELARTVQRELYERLFAGRPVDTYLARIVAELRDGEHDRRLVYRKALRKPLEDYRATSPPHVVAARKLSSSPGRIIEYVMTGAGAEPVAERDLPIAHEHYVDKQIRPVADPVLGLLGLDFAKVIGDDAQMDLF